LIIHCKRKAFFFRVDNVIIRELFNDTKLIAEGRLNEDEKESLNRRYLAQKEYLNYCYAPLKSNLSLELWLNIDSEKSRAGKGNMLHSEYLDWKRTENN